MATSGRASILALAASLFLAGHAAAEGTEKKDAAPKSAAKTYGNKDLEKYKVTREAAEAEAGADGNSAGSVPLPPPEPFVGDERSPAVQERVWRERARTARQAIASAQARVTALEAQATALRNDTSPMAQVMDPFRLQNQQAELAKTQQDIEAARKAQADAEQAFEDLEEEARRSRVPPGWLREP